MSHINLSFLNIIGKLLNEGLNLSNVNDIEDKINYAIDNKLMISLNYDDGKGDEGTNPAYGNPRAFRRIIPYCLGSRKGRLALRGFHSWKNHTKRGPFKWKFFYLDRMSNVRVYKNMQIPEIPALANPEGDKHMDKIINMIGMEKFKSPVEKERETTNAIKTGKPEQNQQGPVVRADLQPKVKPSRYAGISKKYADIQKNINDFDKTNSPLARQQRWSDYDKAEQERQQQQSQVPAPTQQQSGPIGNQPNGNFQNRNLQQTNNRELNNDEEEFLKNNQIKQI